MERDYEDIFDTEDLNPDELRRLVRETLRDNPSIDPDDINVHVRDDKVILTGRVGTDEAKRIAERVDKAVAHVAPERIHLNPDCGFAPGKDHEIPLEEAYLKLKNLAQAARLLRER